MSQESIISEIREELQERMEGKKVIAMICAAGNRMKQCIQEENPTPGEVDKAVMAWSMWIDALYAEKLINAIQQLTLKMDMREFIEKGGYRNDTVNI